MELKALMVGLEPGGSSQLPLGLPLKSGADRQMHDVPSAIQDFVATHEGRRQLTFRLV